MPTTMSPRAISRAKTITAPAVALALTLMAGPVLAQATAPAAPAPGAPPPQAPQVPSPPAGPTPQPAPKSVKLLDGVYEVVASESTDTVYVAATGPREAGQGTVFVLDGATLAVKQKIDVGATAPYGLGINDKTQTLYTSNSGAGSVSAIDLKTGKVLAEITDPAEPKAHTFKVLVDEANNRVYVSIANKVSRIWVIDGRTNTLAHVIQDTGAITVGMAIEPETGMLYAANQRGNEIVEIDPKSYAIVRRFPVGGDRPTQLVIDSKTRRIFVTNQGSGDVSVLDSRTGRVLRTVKTGAGALGIGFNPSNNRLYVANRMTGTVSVVNAESYTIEANVSSGSLPNTIAVNSRTNRTYVTNKARRGPRGSAPVDDPAGDTISIVATK